MERGSLQKDFVGWKMTVCSWFGGKTLMARYFSIVALLWLLSSLTVCAQPGPIVIIEHDWTIQIHGRPYGLMQTRMLGDTRGSYTGVYFSKYLFRINARVEVLMCAVLVPLGIAGFIMGMKKSRTTR
jgi:hypothetical protein